MRSRDSLYFITGGLAYARLYLPPLLFVCAAILCQTVFAQTAPATSAQGNPTVVPVLAGNSTWSSLTKEQQLALAPLAKHWDSLSEGQKRKWIAVAKTYPELGVPDQEKMHSRMVEWAALSPKDRELARLNFAQTKSIAKADRAANWEAYQALSPDERKKLADGAKVKPVGAAVAVKPVASEKLAAVPVTRRTPEPERAAAAASQQQLNRNTLLPHPPTPPSGKSAEPMLLTAPIKP